MKKIIGGQVFDVIPYTDSDKCYCYELNRLVPRHGCWSCNNASWADDRRQNHSCIKCSLSAEYLYVEEQRWVDKGIACWTVTTDGKPLAVQYTEYGFKNRKNKDMVHIEPKPKKILKPYVKPECVVIPDIYTTEINKYFTTEHCGYGLYIKNTYNYWTGSVRIPMPIGWTCKHPDHPNKLNRLDVGYYPFCRCNFDCPKRLEFLKKYINHYKQHP